MALKYYVSKLLESEPLPISEEVSVKEKIWGVRHEREKFLIEAVRTLADRSNALAVATTDDGKLYYAGSANILNFPEFFDIDLTKAVLSHLDRTSFWLDLYHRAHGDSPFYLVLGEEFSEETFFPCGFLYARFHSSSQSGAIGIVGPYRLPYRRLIPMVTYFGEILSELGQ
jgi:heat-inducible transcriptional repressor